MTWQESVRASAAEFGLGLGHKQLDLLEKLMSEVQEANKLARLIADAATEVIARDHFADSLSCFKTGRLDGAKRVIDIGAGAGFPGIPCAIANDKLEVILVESIGKKSELIDKIIAKLGIENAEVVCERAENLAHDPDYRQKFDVALIRGVGHMAEIAELTLPFLRVGGVLLAQKGRRIKAETELTAATGAITKLGGEVVELIEIRSTFLAGERNICIIKKVKNTESKYPRRPGVPHKRALT